MEFRVHGLRFTVKDVGLGGRGVEFRLQGLGSMIYGSGIRVYGFRVKCFGINVRDLMLVI